MPATVGSRGAMVDVTIVAIAACIAGLPNDYANDDVALIARNARIHDLARFPEWFAQSYWPPPFSPDLYRPVTTTLLAIEYALGGGSPMLFRVVSYLLYALVCVAVFILVSRVLPRRAAMASAIVFAAHPVHVEATALAVGQAELVAALLSIAIVARYVDLRRTREPAMKDWAWLAAAYLAACLTKEQGLLIPLIVVAAELLLVERAVSRQARAWTGALLLPGVSILVLVLRRAVLGDVTGSFTAEALDGVGPAGRLLSALALIPQWARLLLWPAHLSADYSPQVITASSGVGVMEALGLALLLATMAAAWRLRRAVPAFTFGVAWCAVTLLPVSNLVVVSGVMLAERTLFSPSIGVVIALAAICDHALRARLPSQVQQRAVATVIGLIALLGIARSIERQFVWRTDAVLVARSITDAPRSFRNQRAFADLMFEINQPALAYEAYALALQYSPRQSAWRVRNSYARALATRGEFAGAAHQFRASLAMRPDQDYERAELVVSLLASGDYASAAAHADTGALKGGNGVIYANLRAIADSAARVHAPAGSIRMGVGRGSPRADR